MITNNNGVLNKRLNIHIETMDDTLYWGAKLNFKKQQSCYIECVITQLPFS